MRLFISKNAIFAGIIYTLLAVLCIQFATGDNRVAQIWLANAFAFAILLRRDRSEWLGLVICILTGNTLLHVALGENWLFGFLDAAGNGVVYVCAAWLVSFLPSSFRNHKDLKGVVAIVLLYALLISPIATNFGAWVIHDYYQIKYEMAWLQRWSSDLFGFMFLFVPIYCLDFKVLVKLKESQYWKSLVGLLLISVMITSLILSYISYPYIYVALPFCLIALQFGFVLTVVVTPMALLFCNLILLNNTIFTPAWMIEIEYKDMLGATAMAAFIPYLIALSIRSIRQQKNQLRTMKERFELASESIGMGVWDWNVETGDLYWDEQMYRLYNIDPNQKENLFSLWQQRVHPEDIGRAQYLLKELVAGRGEYRTEFRVVHDTDHTVWISAAAVVEKNEAGEARRVVGINWDSSKQKLSELNYLNSQRRLRAIINAAEDFSIITTDLNGMIEVFSRGSQLMLGYEADEIENKHNPSKFHDLDEVIERGKALTLQQGVEISGFDVFVHKAKKGLTDVSRWTYIDKNGRRFQVELTVTAVKDVDNTIVGFLGVAQDITEELKAEAELKVAVAQANEQKLIAEQARKQFQTLFDQAPEALLLVNSNGVIVQANIRAHDLFAYNDHELLDQKIDILVPSHVRKQHQAWMTGYISAPKARMMASNLELQGQRKNGGLVSLNINLAPIMIEGMQHTIATVHDVTVQQQTQKLLTDAADKAKAMSRAKSEFVASMSHEIRTPMNAVLASSQLLNKTSLDSTQSRYVDMIQRAGQSLLGILNDILDFSKIEAGKFELQNTAFDLNNLCETLASIMSPNAAQKNIELVIGLDTNAPYLVKGDAPRLQQVLINLLGNAIKFTERGEVFLNVTQLERKENKAYLRFEVIDTGIGIKNENVQILFDAFSQVDGSNTRQYGGTGLGLTISQRLVYLMGGEIKVESKINEGSNFYFDLEMPIQSEKIREYQSLEKIHFIVVDDNQHSRDYICRYLNAWGYKCESFPNLESIELKEAATCCLLLDWSLPSGVMDYVRSLNLDLQKRVFIMQFETERGDISNADLARIAGTISKPVLSSTLYDSLMAVLVDEVKDNSDIKQILEKPLEHHKILIVEDNALNQVVAGEILSDFGAEVEVASNGLEAVNRLKEEPRGFDLVLMDVQMPVMDGYTATQVIREKLQLDLPIIAMTAGVMEREKQSCLDAGMNDFIAKPINMEIMLDTIIKNTLTN